MMQTAPTAVDVLDFQFKLQCRLKIFDSKDVLILNKQCNLVAVASRYGLLFVGSNDSLFQVIELQHIRKYNSKDEVGNYHRRNIILPSSPLHISVNCDCTKLCVVVKDDCVKAIIYDLASFLQQNISIVQEVRLSINSDVDILELVWNPTVASLYAVSKSDGSLAVHDVKETAIDINELPKTTGAICMCWSPKGKQLAIGSNDGKITQYKPDLKIAKVIDSPLLEGPQVPIALQWISNYQFIAVYRSNKDDSQSSLIVINTPKGGGITYVNYEDICYSYGNVRPHQFYIHFQNTWNIVLVASSNSMEVGVLGFEKDIWTQWILADAARAELPLNAAKQDTFPVGLAFDTSSSQSLPWGEATIPPAPLLLLLSDNGVLCCFHVINLKVGAAPICRAAEVLNNASLLPFTTTDSIKQLTKSAQSTTNKQNVIVPQATNNTFTFTFDEALKPIASINSVQPAGIQKNLFTTPINNVPNTSTNTHISFNTLKSGSTSMANSFIPSGNETKLQSENVHYKIQPLQQSNLPERNLLAVNKFMDAEPHTPTEMNEDTESLIIQMVKEEYAMLELEFKTFIEQNKNIKISLGTDKEATNLVQTSSSLQEFLNEINEICQTHTAEIHLLKQTLIQNWAWYEEARSRFLTSKDPSLITLVRAQSLDTASARQLEEIHHLLYYLESQLTHASAALDEQWEMFQNACKKKISLKLPNIEAIYQSMVKQSATIQKQTYILRDISNRIKTNARLRSTPYLLIPVDVDKIEEKLEHLQLQSDPKDVFQIQYKTVFERQSQLTNAKSKKLTELLKSRRLNHVCVTKPQLTKKTLQFNGLMNTSLSPIPPKKEVQPHRLNFIQSAPRILDEHKTHNSQSNEEFKIQQPNLNINMNEHANLESGLSQNANKFNLNTTKPNLVTSCTIPALQSNSFTYGEVKTSPGSAFVPTTQNIFNVKNSSFIDTTVTAKSKNNFSFNNSISVATNMNPPVSESSAIPAIATSKLNSQKDTSNVVSTSGMITPTVDSTGKINFNYPIFASAKNENGTTSDNCNLNAKSITNTTSLLNSSTSSTFKGFNSTPTSHPIFLSTTITPVTIIPKATSDENAVSKNSVTSNTPLMFSTKPFEIPVISSTKVSSNSPSLISTGIRTTTTKDISTKAGPIAATIATPVTILPNTSSQSENQQSISSTPPTLNPFPTPQLLNKVVAPTSVAAASQSVSTVSNILNTSLDLTIKNKTKIPNTIFPTNVVVTEVAKSTTVSEFKPTTGSTTTVQSSITTLPSISPSSTFTFNQFSTGSIFSGFQSPPATFSPQTAQPTFRHTQPTTTSLFDNSQQSSASLFATSEKAVTATSDSLFNTNSISTSTPRFGMSVPIFGNSSLSTSTTTTTSTIFTTNSITATTTVSTFSTANALNSTPDSIFPSNSSTQVPVFGFNTPSTTKPQASVFEASTNNTIFGGTTNMSGPSGSLFGITSTGSLFSTPKTTSTSVFGSSSPNFTAVNSSPSNFFTPSTSTTPIFGQTATFGSTSIFSSSANTNAGSIFGNSPAGVTNAFGTTTTTTNTTPFAPAFGSNANSSNIFAPSNDSFRFATTTGTSTSSGSFGFGNKSVLTTFGNSSSSTDTTPSFGNLSLTTTSSTFGSGFTQNPFNRASNPEQKSPFSGGNLFGSPITTSSTNMFGGTSPFNKATPAFGGPATFGSPPVFGQQNTTFGQSSFGNNSNIFAPSPQLTTFSGNNTTVNQPGFGASPVFGTTSTFGSTTPGGFGAPPTFGSSAFGSNSTFNTTSKPFSNTFGSTGQQNHTFANLANQQTLGFGSLAQQNQTPTSQAPFSGGSSFSTWR